MPELVLFSLKVVNRLAAHAINLYFSRMSKMPKVIEHNIDHIIIDQ